MPPSRENVIFDDVVIGSALHTCTDKQILKANFTCF